MKVQVHELEDKTFRVVFQRSLVALVKDSKKGYYFAVPDHHNKLVRSTSIATVCRIIETGNNEGKNRIWAEGRSICDTRDNFDKSQGRRRAFTQALVEFSILSKPIIEIVNRKFGNKPIEEILDSVHVWLKSIRGVFWKAYFKSMDKKLVRVSVD